MYQPSRYEGRLGGKSVCSTKRSSSGEGGSSAQAGGPCLWVQVPWPRAGCSWVMVSGWSPWAPRHGFACTHCNFGCLLHTAHTGLVSIDTYMTQIPWASLKSPLRVSERLRLSSWWRFQIWLLQEVGRGDDTCSLDLTPPLLSVAFLWSSWGVHRGIPV